MSEASIEMEILDMADEFIAVANRLLEENHKDLGYISTAIRYAAARFSAHEASYKSSDLAVDKDKAKTWYTDQFNRMLGENLEQHVEMAKLQH
jgi:phosphopantetheinyl transferase (holo-ACP synthase)